MKKFTLVVAVVLICAVVLAGCSGGVRTIAKPVPEDSSKAMFEVEGSCEAVLNGNVLTVSGTSNLMDGTNGVISVLNANGKTVDEQKFTKSGDSGSFEFTVTDDWDDIVYGFITFDTQQSDKQPKEVTEAYGKNFEYLDGSTDIVIWDAKSVSAIFQSDAVKIR